MHPIYPQKDTQEYKVLMKLLEANGGWVNKQVFVRGMWLTQAGRAIWNLENRYHWKIEHSDFTDENNFKSYRLLQGEPVQEHLFEVPRVRNLDVLFN